MAFPDVAVGEHARVELGRLAGLAAVEPQAGDHLAHVRSPHLPPTSAKAAPCGPLSSPREDPSFGDWNNLSAGSQRTYSKFPGLSDPFGPGCRERSREGRGNRGRGNRRGNEGGCIRQAGIGPGVGDGAPRPAGYNLLHSRPPGPGWDGMGSIAAPQPGAGRPAPQLCDRRVRRWGEPSGGRRPAGRPAAGRVMPVGSRPAGGPGGGGRRWGGRHRRAGPSSVTRGPIGRSIRSDPHGPGDWKPRVPVAHGESPGSPSRPLG